MNNNMPYYPFLYPFGIFKEITNKKYILKKEKKAL